MNMKTKSASTKSKDTSKKSIVKQNLAASAKKVNERKTLYVYPGTATDSAARKEFRRKARATAKRLDKAIKALAKSNKAEDKKALKSTQLEFEGFKKNTYTQS